MRHRKILEEKLLTIDEWEYDNIGIPKLDIKSCKAKLKLCDAMTITTISELIKLDYYDMVAILANSLEKSNEYEISVVSNALRRRYQSWLDVLWNYTKEWSFIDRSTGEIKTKNNKK